MQNRRSNVAAATMLFVGGAITVFAQSQGPGFGIAIPASSTAGAGDAGVKMHTNVRTVATPASFSGRSGSFGPPFPGYFYEDPASLACVYNLVPSAGPACNPNVVSRNPTGGSKAIAVVDAYDDPNASADLAAFSAQFGIASVTSTSFVVEYAPAGGATPGSCVAGTAPKPPIDPTGGWEIEESLDIEWAHAMAPRATLYLVEAQSNSTLDLLCAVTVASGLVNKAGGGQVSMSWGGGEFPQEALLDGLFTTPKVVYFASAGDAPGPSWPAVSPNVVSAGGTSVSRNINTGNFIGENVWQDAGGGLSAFESRPGFQDGIQNLVGRFRGTPDMALDANPNTGVWVLDNFMPPTGCGAQCWYIVGGTSVASPTLAGIVNSSNTFAASSRDELNNLYNAPRRDFDDITLGSCGLYMGYFASNGWDFCTGLGSPRTNGGAVWPDSDGN